MYTLSPVLSGTNQKYIIGFTTDDRSIVDKFSTSILRLLENEDIDFEGGSIDFENRTRAHYDVICDYLFTYTFENREKVSSELEHVERPKDSKPVLVRDGEKLQAGFFRFRFTDTSKPHILQGEEIDLRAESIAQIEAIYKKLTGENLDTAAILASVEKKRQNKSAELEYDRTFAGSKNYSLELPDHIKRPVSILFKGFRDVESVSKIARFVINTFSHNKLVSPSTNEVDFILFEGDEHDEEEFLGCEYLGQTHETMSFDNLQAEAQFENIEGGMFKCIGENYKVNHDHTISADFHVFKSLDLQVLCDGVRRDNGPSCKGMLLGELLTKLPQNEPAAKKAQPSVEELFNVFTVGGKNPTPAKAQTVEVKPKGKIDLEEMLKSSSDDEAPENPQFEVIKTMASKPQHKIDIEGLPQLAIELRETHEQCLLGKAGKLGNPQELLKRFVYVYEARFQLELAAKSNLFDAEAHKAFEKRQEEMSGYTFPDGKVRWNELLEDLLKIANWLDEIYAKAKGNTASSAGITKSTGSAKTLDLSTVNAHNVNVFVYEPKEGKQVPRRAIYVSGDLNPQQVLEVGLSGFAMFNCFMPDPNPEAAGLRNKNLLQGMSITNLSYELMVGTEIYEYVESVETEVDIGPEQISTTEPGVIYLASNRRVMLRNGKNRGTFYKIRRVLVEETNEAIEKLKAKAKPPKTVEAPQTLWSKLFNAQQQKKKG